MKHYLSILTVLLCAVTQVNAQHRYSKLYNSESGTHDLSTRIEVLSDGFLFCCTSLGGTTPDTFNYAKQSLYIVRTNFAGDTIWTKKYYKRGIGIGARFSIAMSDSTYLLVGRIIDYIAYKDSNIKNDVLLIKINLAGDTLWTKTFSLGKGDELPIQGVKTKDNSYVIMGQSCTQDISNCDYFILKVDSNGNEIFKKKYSYDVNSFEQGRAIVELEDSTLYLFGNTQDNIDEERVYLIKTDKDGNIIWDKRYPGNGYRQLGMTINKIDSGLLLNMAIATQVSDSGDPLLVMIDTSGNILSQRNYGKSRTDALYRVFCLEDKSMIAVGSSQSYKSSNYSVAWIVRIASNGDTLWERTYSSMNLPELKDLPCLFYDIKQIGDGFIILGFAYPKGNFPNSTQDVWLLRVDSMGCLYENCINPTGIGKEENAAHPLIIYPNPAKDKIQFTHSGKITSYRIADYTGKLLLAGNYTERGIDVENLPNGIYIVQVLLEDKSQAFGKLIVEK